MRKDAWKIAAFGIENGQLDPRFELPFTTPACDDPKAGIASFYRFHTRAAEAMHADVLARLRVLGLSQADIDDQDRFFASHGAPSAVSLAKKFGPSIGRGLIKTTHRHLDAREAIGFSPISHGRTEMRDVSRLFWKRALSHVARIYLFDSRRYVESSNPPIRGVVSGTLLQRARFMWRPLVAAELLANFPSLRNEPLDYTAVVNALLKAGSGFWHGQAFRAIYRHSPADLDTLQRKVLSLRAALLERRDWQWEGKTYPYRYLARSGLRGARKPPVAESFYNEHVEDHISNPALDSAPNGVEPAPRSVDSTSLSPAERAFLGQFAPLP